MSDICDGEVEDRHRVVNWSPTANLILRPEIRYDWFDGAQARQPFGDGTNDSQFLLAMDAILLF